MQINFMTPDTNKSLDQVKAEKIDSLNSSCSQTILGKFTFAINGTTYYFYNDITAQANFDKVARVFDKNLVTSISWTAYDANDNVVRVTLDATEFNNLYMAHLQHIQDNITKFRDTLQPQVQAATTVDDVNKITW